MVDRIRAQAVFFSVIMVLSMVAMAGTAAASTTAPADTVDDSIESFDAPGVDAVESVDDESTDLDSNDSDVEVHELTLVSGHAVEVLDDGDRLQVSLEPTEEAEAVEVIATEGQGTYVVPDGVDFDVVDEDLFNVELLIEQDLTDGETDGIPVIVTYADDAAFGTASTAIDGFEPDTEYDIIDGAAGTIDKADAETATATASQWSAIDGGF